MGNKSCAIVINTSDPLTDDIRAENETEDAKMMAVDISPDSIASASEKIPSVTLETSNSNSVKGVNKSDDSIDEKKTSRLNDHDNGQTLALKVEERSASSSSVVVKNENNDDHETKGGDKNESENNKQSNSDDSDGNSSDDESDSDSDSDSDSNGEDNKKPDDGISAYERLRIDRIRRNEERLKQLGLVNPNKKVMPPKKKKRVSLGGAASHQKSNENDVPTRSQPKRSAKKKLIYGQLLSGGDIDLRRNWPLRQSPKDRFGHQKQAKAIAEKNRYSKRYRCGECLACKRETNCQTCYFCVINGLNTRRRCIFRTCLRRLVDIEVEVEPEAEENEKNEPSINENTSDAAAPAVDHTADKCDNADGVANDDGIGDVDKGTTIVNQEIDTNFDKQVDGDDEAREQTPRDPKTDAVDEVSAKEYVCTDEKGEFVKTEEVDTCEEKIPIENSEYYASYRMEDGGEGLPKWMDEFYEFMSTIPHGPWNRTNGQKNLDNTISQISKLVTGEGITYHLWPEGTNFKKGIKVHLGMDLSALHKEAVILESQHEDRRKGSLLRHPIAKMICYKEWISNGKPKAARKPPMSPLLALPPPISNSSDNSKDGNDDQKPGKRIITMTIEDQIKPNRVKWVPTTVQISSDAGVEEADVAGIKDELALANDDAENKTQESIEDRNNNGDAESRDGSKTESNLLNDDENTTTKKAVENGNCTSENAEVANVDAKIVTIVSQGDDKENRKELLSSNNGETKTSDNGDKDAVAAGINESNGIDVSATKVSADTTQPATNEADDIEEAATKASSDDISATKNETSNTDTTNMMPNGCAVCSRGGDLICCDGCDLGFHSNCHNPRIKEIPIGEWFCRECKRKKQKKPKRPKSIGISKDPKRKIMVNHKLFEGEHEDDCYICYLGGDLICCDFCEKAYHLACHIPPLPFIPEGLWKCCECMAVERKKKSRCGECEACTRDDCGKCKHCLDKPKFGGTNRLKQVCIKKVCPYPRFAPPASSNTVAGAITGKASINKATPSKSAPKSNPVLSTGKKRGRPRKSVDSGNLPMIGGDNLSINGSGIPTTKKKRGRPRKSVDSGNLPMIGSDNLSINGSGIPTTKKKRGRPRKSVDSDEMHESKRVKIESADEGLIDQPVVFKFKISSFKPAYRDPESLKIRKVIKSALRDPSDSKVVDKACEHLRKCMKSVESVKTAILFGGVEMVCNAMRDHLNKSILQAEACCTLAEMLWVFPGIATKLAYMGAIDLIITTIHNCANNAKVQQMGSSALGAFSYEANFVQHIMDAGGLQAVIAAVERFPKKVTVQMEGWYFFQNLIVRSVDALNAVSNSQVVLIIVETMSNANLGAEVLLPMCGLIANLAVNNAAKESIGQSDAIPAFLSLLSTTNDVEVKQATCTVLKNLAVGSSDNQTKIAEKGGLDALFGVIRSHPSDSLLLVLSFNVMKELCINDEEVAYQIVKNGGIKIILKAMENNSDNATMQVAACAIIGYLLLKGKSEIHAPKLVMAIVSAMKNHSENSDVQIQACDALFELSQVPTTRLILKKKETQELLLRAKSHFKSCESDVDDIIASSNK